MTVVKVCGVKELAPMLVAAEAGADMVGVNFVPGVRRRVEPAFAREMVAQFRASYLPLRSGRRPLRRPARR